MKPPITLMMGIPTSQTIFSSSPASYTCFSPTSRLLVVIMLWPPASLPENGVSRPPTSQMNFKSPPASLSRFYPTFRLPDGLFPPVLSMLIKMRNFTTLAFFFYDVKAIQCLMAFSASGW